MTPEPHLVNPVLQQNFADPQVIRTDGGYLALATNGNGANVQTAVSTDLATWSVGDDALPVVAEWSAEGKVWAPEAARIGGRWRLYYTTRGPDPEVQCLSVATADRPEGPYEDISTRPLVCQTDEGGSIDASPFVDADGTAWLYWKNDGNAVGRDTWIYAQRLSEDGSTLLGRPNRLFRQTEPWEGHLVEAPFVWRAEQDGRAVYHLFYSANDYGSADYAVGHAVADAPDGPFTRDAQPVLSSNEVAAGPGHCALFTDDRGQLWMIYHAWSPEAVGDESVGRQMWLSRVRFDGRQAQVDPPSLEPKSVG